MMQGWLCAEAWEGAAWKGRMTNVVLIRVLRDGPTSEFPSIARGKLSGEVTHRW